MCEPPHASDDTRLDLPDHGQALRLSSEGSDSRPIWAVQLRPQLNSGSRFRTERTVSGLRPGTAVADRLWGRVASPDLLRGRTDRRPVRLDPGACPHRPALRSCRIMRTPIRGEATRRAQPRLCSEDHVHDDAAT